jgi:hypothetical protein
VALTFLVTLVRVSNGPILIAHHPLSKPLPLSIATLVSANQVAPVSLVCLVSFSLVITMSGRRSVPRIRTRRHGPPSPERSPVRVLRELDLEEVDPDRMIEYLRTTGRLPNPNLGPPGSNVPAQPTADEATVRLVSSMEAMLQRILVQTTPVAPVPGPSTAPSTQTPTASTSGKPQLKFPDPPMYEGDPKLLDG